MTNSNYKLTKEDFKQINKRSLFTFQLGWNYERMQGSGYLYMLLPQLRKMYGDGTPELKEMMKLHTQFFNTSPFFHTIIAGFDLAMEEKDGVKSKDAVNGIKTGLMGPFAPLGELYLWLSCASHHGIYRCYYGYCRPALGNFPLDCCSSCL